MNWEQLTYWQVLPFYILLARDRDASIKIKCTLQKLTNKWQKNLHHPKTQQKHITKEIENEEKQNRTVIYRVKGSMHRRWETRIRTPD